MFALWCCSRMVAWGGAGSQVCLLQLRLSEQLWPLLGKKRHATIPCALVTSRLVKLFLKMAPTCQVERNAASHVLTWASGLCGTKATISLPLNGVTWPQSLSMPHGRCWFWLINNPRWTGSGVPEQLTAFSPMNVPGHEEGHLARAFSWGYPWLKPGRGASAVDLFPGGARLAPSLDPFRSCMKMKA